MTDERSRNPALAEIERPLNLPQQFLSPFIESTLVTAGPKMYLTGGATPSPGSVWPRRDDLPWTADEICGFGTLIFLTRHERESLLAPEDLGLIYR